MVAVRYGLSLAVAVVLLLMGRVALAAAAPAAVEERDSLERVVQRADLVLRVRVFDFVRSGGRWERVRADVVETYKGPVRGGSVEFGWDPNATLGGAETVVFLVARGQIEPGELQGMDGVVWFAIDYEMAFVDVARPTFGGPRKFTREAFREAVAKEAGRPQMTRQGAVRFRGTVYPLDERFDAILDGLIADADPAVRIGAAKSIAEMKRPEYAARLRPLLVDKTAVTRGVGRAYERYFPVRAEAADAMRRLGVDPGEVITSDPAYVRVRAVHYAVVFAPLAAALFLMYLFRPQRRLARVAAVCGSLRRGIVIASLACLALWPRSKGHVDQFVVYAFGSRIEVTSARETLHLVNITCQTGAEPATFASFVPGGPQDQLWDPDALSRGEKKGFPGLNHASSPFGDVRWRNGSGTGWSAFTISYGAVLMLAFYVYVIVLAVGWPSRHRIRDGHCPECDYDLRMTPLHCPECGWVEEAVAEAEHGPRPRRPGDFRERLDRVMSHMTPGARVGRRSTTPAARIARAVVRGYARLRGLMPGVRWSRW
jgi:hypothetical protein